MSKLLTITMIPVVYVAIVNIRNTNGGLDNNNPLNRFVNTGWPLMLTFVGVMFAWGVAQF